MQMKMMGRLMAAALLSVAAGCQGDESAAPADNTLGAQEAAAGTQCVQRFDGITSCGLGNAQLAPTETGIKVAGLADASKDGISGSFAKATRWTQKLDVKFGTAKAGINLAARAGDQTVGTLQMTPLRDGTSMAVLPSFSGAPGGSAYRMNVYNDGVLQGGTTQPAGSYMIIRDWYDLLRWLVAVYSFDNGYEIIIWKPGATAAATETIPGACVWRMRNERGTFSVQLADGTVLKGNQVEFVEQIEDGHYPYTDFTAIDVKAAANEFTVLGETFVPAK